MPGRYVIYGAGAIGGVIGGGLALGGRDVALIARGDHVRALRTRGLELRTADGTHVISVPAVEDPADLALTEDDIVVLAMKTQDTEAALDALASTAPAALSVVCAQNGVENERLALRRFANVYGMCVMLPGVHLEPGVVEGAGSPVFGVLDVGRYPMGNDTTAEAIAADLEGSGFRSRADEAIMRYKYAKLRVNTGNALDAACGRSVRGSELAARAAREALDAFRAAGIDVATKDEEAARREGFKTLTIDGQQRAGSSSWQSLAKGSGSIEADFLNGEIVLLGRLHGVPTPVNEALRRLANRMARRGEAPGSVTMEEAEALVASLA
ncbi:MAG: 2-dehydropantoate 2-reductase [Acidimicrobiia bacterium]|nr:2-dehydropantoate 2-reductase [Acidimicrobiia bacterium]